MNRLLQALLQMQLVVTLLSPVAAFAGNGPTPPARPATPAPSAMPVPPVRVDVNIHPGFDDEDDDDDRRHGRELPDKISTSVPTQGPVEFRMEAMNSDIEVVASSGNRAAIIVNDGSSHEVRLVPRGDNRLEPEFDGHARLRRGDVRLELPKGSKVDLTVMSGDIKIRGVGGDVRVRTTAGDVMLASAKEVNAQTVEGDIKVRDASGPVRIKTVQGDAEVTSSAGPAAQLEFESTAGELSWRGICGKGCHLMASTLSGDVKLVMDPKSSFEVELSSRDGELKGGLPLTRKAEAKRRRFGNPLVGGTYGAGEGVVEVETFSGDLDLESR